MPRPFLTRLLALLTLTAAVYYAVWRVGATNTQAWAVAVPLLGAELFGILHLLGFQYTVWPRPEPVLSPSINPAQCPVFVFIPTVNEGIGVLEPTVQGALAARLRFREQFPDAAPVRIIVCNDGRVARAACWLDVEQLAERLGVECETRQVSGGAKAGNIEHARQKLVPDNEDALLVIFDADMVAHPDFLVKTVPPFADPSVGWVQTGQYYGNLQNPVARWAEDQQSLFFGTLAAGKARLNALFICGTNVVIRNRALSEIGGLPQSSVTEDFAASVLLHARWRCVYQPERLAVGLGPVDMAGYLAQQRRWAAGTLGVLKQNAGLLLLPGPAGQSLTGPQRVQYLLSCTHYLFGVSNLVFLLAPLLYLATGVSALHTVTLSALLSHFLPFYALSQLAFWHAAGGRAHVRGSVIGFASTPVLIGALLSVIKGERLRFVATPKARKRLSRPSRTLLPHGVTALVCAGAVAYALTRPGPLAGVCAFWLGYALVVLCGVLGLGFLDARTGRGLPALALRPGAKKARTTNARRFRLGGKRKAAVLPADAGEQN